MLSFNPLEFPPKPVQIAQMTASPTDAIATLRIEIKYIESLIWRRVAVRTLDEPYGPAQGYPGGNGMARLSSVGIRR
jgi:hypothetical protein